MREGIAEIVKSAAIADVELWHRLSSLENEQDLVAHAEEIITACCKIKRDVVEEDEKHCLRKNWSSENCLFTNGRNSSIFKQRRRNLRCALLQQANHMDLN